MLSFLYVLRNSRTVFCKFSWSKSAYTLMRDSPFDFAQGDKGDDVNFRFSASLDLVRAEPRTE